MANTIVDSPNPTTINLPDAAIMLLAYSTTVAGSSVANSVNLVRLKACQSRRQNSNPEMNFSFVRTAEYKMHCSTCARFYAMTDMIPPGYSKTGRMQICRWCEDTHVKGSFRAWAQQQVADSSIAPSRNSSVGSNRTSNAISSSDLRHSSPPSATTLNYSCSDFSLPPPSTPPTYYTSSPNSSPTCSLPIPPPSPPFPPTSPFPECSCAYNTIPISLFDRNGFSFTHPRYECPCLPAKPLTEVQAGAVDRKERKQKHALQMARRGGVEASLMLGLGLRFA